MAMPQSLPIRGTLEGASRTMNTQQLCASLNGRFHPIANLFPLLEGEPFDCLVADIRANGLHQPIVEFEGLILDGRNRYRACLEAGVPVRTEGYAGNDPLGYVISANLRRRHLGESQRGMVAAKLETMKQGRPAKDAILHVSRIDASRMLNVSPRTIAHAAVVRDRGTPELLRRVENGNLAVSVAARIADLPPEKQRDLADADEAVLRNATKAHRRARREEQLADTTRHVSATLGTQRYGVILADPPWRFEPRSRETGLDRSADNHYPTLTTNQIAKLSIPAAPDCVLFLWATAPMLQEALEVLRKWGFAYRSHLMWIKDRIGTGYWCRNRHEILLIGRKGDVPAPAPGQQPLSAIEAAVGQHSEKPACFAEIIEQMFPNTPRVELFARFPRLGWDVWGNEVKPDTA